MNVKKAISTFATQIENAPSQKEALEKLEFVLNSYDIQCKSGIDKYEAFLNAIYSPSKEFKKEIKEELDLLKQRKRGKKFHMALRFEHGWTTKKGNTLKETLGIKEMREKRWSYQAIANYLNQYCVHKSGFFTKKNICDFCLKREIKKGNILKEKKGE